MAGDRRARRAGRPRARAARRAADAGRRADVRVDRRHGRPGVELHRASRRAKRELAEALLRRLAQRFAPGGLLHYGQGKWYPGEPLPRWALGVYWRTDGEPLWRDAALLADTTSAGQRDDRRRAARSRARSRQRLGLPTDAARSPRTRTCRSCSRPRRALPVNVDPLQADLAKPDERARLARLLMAGLDEPAGFVLPLKAVAAEATADRQSAGSRARGRCAASGCMRSPAIRRSACACRSARCPSVLPDDEEHELAGRSVRAARGAAQPRDALRRGRGERRGASRARSIKTALCAARCATATCTCSCRRSRALEDYVALLAAIEDTARATAARRSRSKATRRRATRASTVLDGHARSRRHRGQRASGVDVARARSTITETLYEEARQARLGTEKFMLDGRHTGTGGGNHVTLGGATPADSPLLRRPDLLRSLITYWQNHPALSYLFSGHVHRPDEPGAARRRGARRPPVRARDRLPADGAQAAARRGVAAAVARRPPAAPPADRSHRQHASRRVLDRQAVFARQRRPAASACSSSAPSRCRRIRR